MTGSASTTSSPTPPARPGVWPREGRALHSRLSARPCPLGLAQLERLDTLLAGRERVAALYRETLGELEGVTLPCENFGQARRGWVVFVIPLPHGGDRDNVVTALGTHGVAAKPYFPAIHLMSYYRREFGYREGQF